MRVLNLIFILFLAVFSGPYALAEDAASGDPLVKIRILPERGEIKAGEEIWIGVEQAIAPHWHTYWKNPGDSGSEPRIDWTLPEGFEIGEIQWPTPKKLPFGPLLNYGYEDGVILLQKLQAPAVLPKGPLNLTAEIDVLVCKEECIPEFGTYELILNGPDAAAENNTDYLREAQAKIPTKTNWSVSYREDNGNFVLDFSGTQDLSLNGVFKGSIKFFPLDWGFVDNTAKPEIEIIDGGLVLKQKRGERDIDALERVRGLLVFKTPDGLRQAAEFAAMPVSGASADTPNGNGALEDVQQTGFVKAALLAVLGGLILNLMPCVFPVLSIKALSLVKIAEKHPEQARIHGLAYTSGVILSFLAIAGGLIALKASGSAIGWGFQLQDPVVVTLLAYLLFIIGLNLSGVFEFGGGLTNIGSKLTGGHGYNNSFFTGVLATLVATPCTAPFMGVAIGYALFQPPIISLSIFAALGFGLALPYLALSFLPSLQHILPKPGAWMDTFKQFLAFPMYASAAWLVWVMLQQAGPHSALGALFGFVALAFGLWLMSHKPQSKGLKNFVNALIVVSFLAAAGFLPSGKDVKHYENPARVEFGQTYSEDALQSALNGNEPVFVEMTAAWCITCKVNHASSINIDSTMTLFDEKNVQYFIGDWTNQDAHITKYLDSFGRSGVPIYVYYGPRSENGQRPEPRVLPQILTPMIVAEYVQ